MASPELRFEAIVTVSPALAAPDQVPVCAADALVLLPATSRANTQNRCSRLWRLHRRRTWRDTFRQPLSRSAGNSSSPRPAKNRGPARVLVSVLAPPAPTVGRSTGDPAAISSGLRK